MFRRYLNLTLTAVVAMLTTFLLLFLTVAPLSAQDDDDDETVPAADLADPEGQFIMIDGLEIYYIDQGPTDAPAVLLLHGFGGSTFTWRFTAPTLLNAGYRVISYDRPPFGLSAKQSDITLTDAAQAERLAGLMDALDIESAVLVGHSAGGGVIAQFAAAHPDRVNGLVFAAGAVGGGSEYADTEATPEADTDASPLGRLFELGAMIDPENPSTRTLIRRLLTPEQFVSILTDAYHPDFEVTAEIEAGYARVLRVDDWEVGLLSILTQTEAGDPVDLDALSALDVPVLLIWGEDDTWVPFERAGFLRMAFPEAEIITFPDTGHMPMEERPERFNNALLMFLNE